MSRYYYGGDYGKHGNEIVRPVRGAGKGPTGDPRTEGARAISLDGHRYDPCRKPSGENRRSVCVYPVEQRNGGNEMIKAKRENGKFLVWTGFVYGWIAYDTLEEQFAMIRRIADGTVYATARRDEA